MLFYLFFLHYIFLPHFYMTPFFYSKPILCSGHSQGGSTAGAMIAGGESPLEEQEFLSAHRLWEGDTHTRNHQKCAQGGGR
jgi:hypothetical protein